MVYKAVDVPFSSTFYHRLCDLSTVFLFEALL